MTLASLTLGFGFVLLYFGAEWLIEGATNIAQQLRLAKAFVGLTLVAFGTSAPEFFVNILAGINGESEFALSNVSGSNMTNLCLGFGISALVSAVPFVRKDFALDGIMAVAGPLIILTCLLITAPERHLPLWMSLPMIAILVWYLWSLAKRRAADVHPEEVVGRLSRPMFFFVVGVIALYAGGELVFRSAKTLAELMKMPAPLIGLTIVAGGTSIPDVTASVIAARRKEMDICIGNLLGSNISNIFVVLTGTVLAARQDLRADRGITFDYAVVSGLTLLFLLTVCWKQRIPRWFAGLLLIAYVTFFIVRIEFILT